MHWYLEAYRQYWNFKGRSRRTEFWGFALIHVAIFLGLAMAGSALSSEPPSETQATVLGLVVFTYLAGAFVPTLSVTARRLHDVGLSGWLQVITFIPILNIIGIPVVLVIAMIPGRAEPNRYGPDPKGRESPRSLGHPTTPGPSLP